MTTHTTSPNGDAERAGLPQLYRFDRYYGGEKMAEGIGAHATSMAEATEKAEKLAQKYQMPVDGVELRFVSNKPCVGSCSICAAFQAARRSPVADAAGELPEPSWGRMETVGDMVRNLLTLDQSAPIYAAFHVDYEGKRRCRTRDICISRERVIDGKWVDSTRKDVPYAHVVWAKPDERTSAPEAAPVGMVPVYQAFLGTEGWIDIEQREVAGYQESQFQTRTLYAPTSASAQPVEQPAPLEPKWQPITKPGQVKVGDKLRFTIGDQKYNEVAKQILDAGTDREEIIYNKRRNYYIITLVAIENHRSHRDVEFLPMHASSAQPPEDVEHASDKENSDE